MKKRVGGAQSETRTDTTRCTPPKSSSHSTAPSGFALIAAASACRGPSDVGSNASGISEPASTNSPIPCG
jgi:hypothetical protein